MTGTINRRALLERIAAAAGATLWMGDSLAVELAKAAAGRAQEPEAAAAEDLPAALLPTLTALAELIIPATDTPGATEAEVPAFVADMFRHWMNGSERSRFVAGLKALDEDAQRRFGQGFAAAAPARQAEVFGALREGIKDYKAGGLAARLADPAAPFFHKARDLVTVGYFTSRVGIQAELAYVAVPGRFEGDVDVKTWQRQMQL